MYGSFIQSHWPCITLWPISMFSRILAIESAVVPATHAGLRRDASSSTRPSTTSRRCISIIDLMERRARPPSSAKTSSWIASNSLPSCSICSSVSRASGLSIIVSMLVLSEGDLDGALGCVDAGAHDLALGAGDLARAEVADLARAELSDARVADAHPAAVGQRGAGLLAGHEHRLGAVALGLDAAVEELDRAALAELAVALADDGLEALHVQAIAVAGLLPVLAHRVEHVARAREEGLALAPVADEVVEVVGPDAAVLAGELLVQAEARVALGELAQLPAEDDLLARARRVQVHDVVELAAPVEVAQHAHDRRDPAARADEQQLVRQRVGQGEGALDAAEAHDRPRGGVADQVRGDLALLDELGRDADQAVRPAGVGGQRVGAPVVHAVDDEADAQVLARLVPGPLPAGLDEDRDRVGGLALDALDAAA